MIDPKAPAYPVGEYLQISPWLPPRLELAARMMAAMGPTKWDAMENDELAILSLHMADALIAAYNEGEK